MVRRNPPPPLVQALIAADRDESVPVIGESRLRRLRLFGWEVIPARAAAREAFVPVELPLVA